ncbi:MAG: polysaccharide deacetylase family protein [Pseudoxanthomonas sp.]|nr:polysaccharide deacetylase family protein [Pseudoxanthomonas sp.]
MRGSIGWSCVLSVACLLAPLAQAKEPPRFAWPDGQKAAVNLGYDDALDSQLDNAIPALDRHGLKGTFYVVPANPPLQLRMDDWRAAARNGHELGNHSLFHQCSARGAGREWVKPERDLDRVSVAQMREQVALANTFLQALDGRAEARTFTAPCGDRQARDGDYIAALGDMFAGIKMVGGTAVVLDMATLDPRNVPAHVPVDASGAQLIALVKEAARRGTMISFTFHGIGGDHLSVSDQAHEELLAYLDAHRDTYWTATFLEQMRWVRGQQEKAKAARPD